MPSSKRSIPKERFAIREKSKNRAVHSGDEKGQGVPASADRAIGGSLPHASRTSGVQPKEVGLHPTGKWQGIECTLVESPGNETQLIVWAPALPMIVSIFVIRGCVSADSSSCCHRPLEPEQTLRATSSLHWLHLPLEPSRDLQHCRPVGATNMTLSSSIRNHRKGALLIGSTHLSPDRQHPHSF